MENAAPTSGSETPGLRRVLSFRDLFFYGVVAVTPSAPVTVFGLASRISEGHAVAVILIAMVAMVFTAVSYGRMAAVYPSAGSAYTYVGRGLHPHLGFLTGWAMLLDYVFTPLFCVIYASISLERLFPRVPYSFWAGALTALTTYLNLRGIRSTARANKVLLGFMGLVLVGFDVLAVRYIVASEGWGRLFSTAPFYSPATFHIHSIARATSFAALTYLGFDSVTTLAEDARNPRRNILLATVSVCLFTGLFGGILVYLGQRVWPDYGSFRNVETAFMDVSRRVGGPPLFDAMVVLLVAANIGAALTSQVGAARLMYGMGRDNVLPRRVFAYLDPVHNTPAFNIWLIGSLAFGGSLVMKYELTAELLNFGALLGFMAVNFTAFWRFLRGGSGHRNIVLDALVPALGFLFCLGIWWGLPAPAKIAGSAWLLAGSLHLVIRTRGFRKPSSQRRTG